MARDSGFARTCFVVGNSNDLYPVAVSATWKKLSNFARLCFMHPTDFNNIGARIKPSAPTIHRDFWDFVIEMKLAKSGGIHAKELS